MAEKLLYLTELVGLKVFDIKGRRIGRVKDAALVPLIDAARVDGASRIEVLLRIMVPLARPGIVAVALLVAVFTWNDFSGSLVLIQKPDAFTVQLALTRFSTLYATDQGLTFAGMAIVILPPLLLFLVLQRSFIQGLAAGAIRR